MITPRYPPGPERASRPPGPPPVATPALSERDASHLARLLKAASDPTRLQILAQLATGDRDALSVADLTHALDSSQSTISHHLKILLSVNLVTRQNRGTFRYYRSAPNELNAIGDVFIHGPVAFTAHPDAHRRDSSS